MFNRPNVMLCYFDESGDEQPLRRPDELLVFVLVAIVVDQAHIGKLQQDFLALKLQTLSARDRQTIGTSALVKFERKGSQFRRALKQQKRGSRRASLGFLDAFIQIPESNQISIEFACRLKGSARLSSDSYAESVAEILTSVNNHAQLHDARFLAVLDSRTHAKNAPTVAYVFDQMTTAHQPLSRLIEPPLFGHSDAHILLQVADVLASGMLAPMLSYTIAREQPNSPFGDFAIVEERYRARIEALRINSVTEKLTS
jgi:hypothetical protein